MKIEEKFVARLSVHSIPVTDARNEETMHGFARRIEATPPGQCALALQLSLLEASALQTCGKCVPCRDGLPQLAKLMRRIVDCEAQPEDLGRLKTLAEFIRLGSDCAIGYDAAQMVLESSPALLTNLSTTRKSRAARRASLSRGPAKPSVLRTLTCRATSRSWPKAAALKPLL